MGDTSAVETDKTDVIDNDELLIQIKKNIKESRAHFSQWRKDAKQDYDFYAGKQWDDDDIALMQEQGRPAVVFNRTMRTINTVGGLEVQNRQEVRFYGRKIADSEQVGTGEQLTDASKWVRDECDAEDEESESFQDAAICGMGWTETRLDYETDAEGVILIERHDPIEMGIDHTAKKRNGKDSRFRYRIINYSRQEFEEKFPGEEIPKGRFFDTDEDEKQVQDLSPGRYAPDADSGQQRDTKQIQVCQYQYYKTTKVHLVQNTDGTTEEIPASKFKEAKERFDQLGIQYTKTPRPKRKYYQCFLHPEKIIEGGDSPVDGFTFELITGFRDRNKNTWFGLVRPMRDPQMWANKWLSQIQHILNTQAKAGKLLYETGALKNPAKAKDEWARPDAALELNNGALTAGKIQIHQGSGYPDGIDRLLQYAMEAINDVPGVSLELMGLANRDQANVLEQSRKQAGVTILAILFDALRRYRKTQGRILGEFIQSYISDGRLIRVTGKTGPEYVPLNRDPTMLKYDVIVDDAPSSPNQKDRVFAAMQAIFPMVEAAGVPVPPDILDYTPLPEGLIQSWKQYIQQVQSDPQTQQRKQMADAAQMADVEHKKSQADLNKAKAMKEMHDLQNPPDATLEMAKAHASHELERHKVTSDIGLKREEMQANLALKREDMLLGHHVSLEGKKLQAEASAKPTTKVSLGSDEAVNALSDTLSQGLAENNQTILAAVSQNTETVMQGLTLLADKMIEGDKLLASAITAPKRIVLDKNKKPIGVETVKH